MGTRARLIATVAVAATVMAGPGAASAETVAEVVAKSVREPEMVPIPAGEFTMGVQEGPADARAHRVQIDAFLLDATEVTNGQYFAFCQATGRRLPELWGRAEYHCGLDFPNHPVVGVSWYDARDYAEWAGKRLPSEAEWEYAARGGLEGALFPHGDELTANDARFNPSRGTTAVASYPPNGFGLYDMAGNVVEWVADYYASAYPEEVLQTNPGGPATGKFRVIRGGGWHSGPYCNRVYHRNALPSNWVDMAVGFRCARDLGDTDPTPAGESDCVGELCGQDTRSLEPSD
jgi:formylglycine-generating enzyme required for sulfatase activity